MPFQKHELVASIVRESFYEFVCEFWPIIIEEEPVLNWHIRLICDEIQAIVERVIRGEPREYDVIINVPPGSTKSTLVSQMLPAWVWTRMPSAKFICCSYADRLALRDSVKCRDLVQSDLYRACFSDIGLRDDQNTKGLFENKDKGYRFATGVGGTLTGFHGHFLIVDDPLNPEEAVSEAELIKVTRWMKTTLPTRRIDKSVAVMILVQQRLHQADPTGDLLERTKGIGIRHICLPGEITDDVAPPEARAFYKDGLFDPVRLPRATLDHMRRIELGEYGYAGQILQKPVALGGNFFRVDCLQIVDMTPRGAWRRVRSWDKAGTQEGGNRTAGVKMATDGAGLFVVEDVVKGQWDAPAREAMIRQTAQVDGKEVEIVLEIEGGSGGKESGQNTVRNLSGYRVHTFHPTGDKESRAYALASQIGGGNVIVLNRDWTADYIEEMRYFPGGRFDDQVDASSSGFNRLARKPRKAGGW